MSFSTRLRVRSISKDDNNRGKTHVSFTSQLKPPKKNKKNMHAIEFDPDEIHLSLNVPDSSAARYQVGMIVDMDIAPPKGKLTKERADKLDA